MAASVPVIAAGSIDQRFAQLIQQFGLTKNSFAMSLGKTASVVQHLIDGRNKPGFDLMCKVFEVYPNVSKDWLLLGRGPMLVGSNNTVPLPAPAVGTPASTSASQAEGFEPIDLADVAPRAPRRPSVTKLHPEEIAATLALASAAAQSASAESTIGVPSATARVELPPAASQNRQPAEVPAPEQRQNQQVARAATAARAASEQRPVRPFRPRIKPVSEPLVGPEPAATPTAPPAPESAAPTPLLPLPAENSATHVPVATASPNAEAYVTAAIHAQHLQHQLALAELRNQHLLEQQQLLREMLAMARQAMV